MKVGILIALTAVILGGLVGTLVIRDPGYVLIAYADMAVESSLWFVMLLLVAAYVLIRFTMFAFTRSMSSGGRFGEWLRRRRARSAQQQTVQGLLLMAEGEWAEARRILVGSANEVRSPLINYLNAARAAHEVGDTQGRDDLLRQAHESTPGSRFAVGLTQAQLQMSAEQWEQCLATLLQLRSESPRHRLVLSMLADCYRHVEDWRSLIELIPDLKKRKVLDGPALTDLQLLAWGNLLEQDQGPTTQVWQNVPKDLKRRSELVAIYAGVLQGRGNMDEAESLLRDALGQNWEESLVVMYGCTHGGQPDRQLVTAEAWLKEKPNDPMLLLTLGRVCMMNHQWAKAREYLETSLRLMRTPEVYGELGRLCIALGDVDRGGEYLSQSFSALPELPLP